MDTWIIALIVVSIGLFAMAETLVAYQKYRIKKQFIEELDQKEREQQTAGSGKPE